MSSLFDKLFILFYLFGKTRCIVDIISQFLSPDRAYSIVIINSYTVPSFAQH